MILYHGSKEIVEYPEIRRARFNKDFILDFIARNIKANCCARIGCTCYKELPVKKMADTYNRYFMRLIVEDRCGVLAEMTEVFAKYHVSIAQIIQKDSQNQDDHLAEVVVITSKVREGDFKTAVQELSNKSSVKRISKTIRVYRK